MNAPIHSQLLFSRDVHDPYQASVWLIETILQSQRNGNTCLPVRLGLSEFNYEYLKDLLKGSTLNRMLAAFEESEDLRQQLLEMRLDEWRDVRDLLLENRTGDSEFEVLFAEIVAAACLGGDHLWRDLGMPDRAALSYLLNTNFGPLAQRNDKDMKWKKFFYKQLCEKEGGYVCRAPSCDECAAYDDCFGPED